MIRLRSSHVVVSRGFTLIETIVVVVVLAIAAVAIGAIQGRLFQDQAGLKKLQVGTKLMQECAEQVLGVRRSAINGYDVLVNTYPDGVATPCGGITVNPSMLGNTPTVTLSTYPDTLPGCPAGYACRLAKISQDGMAELAILLVAY